MSFIDIINFALALATIGLGVCGWLATRWTMEVIDMESGPTGMAYTEVAAASGALFVGLGIAAMVLNDPLGWIVMGAAYGGAAIGRLTAILRDGVRIKKAWTFFACESVFAAWLILVNLSAG